MIYTFAIQTERNDAGIDNCQFSLTHWGLRKFSGGFLMPHLADPVARLRPLLTEVQLFYGAPYTKEI